MLAGRGFRSTSSEKFVKHIGWYESMKGYNGGGNDKYYDSVKEQFDGSRKGEPNDY